MSAVCLLVPVCVVVWYVFAYYAVRAMALYWPQSLAGEGPGPRLFLWLVSPVPIVAVMLVLCFLTGPLRCRFWNWWGRAAEWMFPEG